ncbi:Hyalin [Holothuria leucospilota]|uniref:Hyalin n=1 Tax=Holothuria leucospilota TaxID=206669 RepID=A0A9Q1C1S2_HOLLE|nr:Hyalin [Holothuria leucospilota]
MAIHGRKYLIVTWFLMLFQPGAEPRNCGTKGCDSGGKTYQYVGHLREQCSSGRYAVGSRAVCTTGENVSVVPNMKIVTYGSGATYLPSRIVCQGPDPYFTRCSGVSGRNCHWRTPLVCREIDVVSPTANCPSAKHVNADDHGNTAVVTWDLASCSDNSGDVPLNCTHQPGDQFGIGVTTVRCTCTDKSGNTDQCSFNITVKDVTRPTANCPSRQVQQANLEGNTKAVVIWEVATCSDNSQMDARLECSHQPGDEYDLGKTTVQCNCTDMAGNMGQCSFKVDVKDVTRPTVNCPAKKIVNADRDDNTKAVVTWNPVPCSDNSPSDLRLNCSHQSGDKFGLGNTEVQCNCTDKSQNTGQCSFGITVKDVTKPTANCPSRQVQQANLEGNTKAVVIWEVATCSDNSQMDARLECSHQPGDEYDLGKTTVQCNCTDMAGNMGQCSFKVVVKDVTSPTARCPTTQTVNASLNGDTTATVEWNLALCSDNSREHVQLHCTHQPGNEFDLGKTTVQCNCTDMSGNMGQCTFNIIVKGSTEVKVGSQPSHSPVSEISSFITFRQWRTI